jgi:hypothetical protein
MRYTPDVKLVDQLQRRIHTMFHLFRQQETVILLWSYAKLGIHPGSTFITAFCEHLLHSVDGLNAQVCQVQRKACQFCPYA